MLQARPRCWAIIPAGIFSNIEGGAMAAWVIGTVGVWFLFCCQSASHAELTAHVWELHEIELHASKSYANPYVNVETWVELTGPGFAKRVYGFWDGGDVYRVRIVATAPGTWNWISGSNQPADAGLNGKRGRLTARDWTDAEKRANPNRRGFLRPTS